MVAQAVIDELEAVEIDEGDRDLGAVALRGENRLLQAVVEQRPVGQPGQRVVVGLLLDPGLVQLALGDVLDRAFVAAARAPSSSNTARAFSEIQMMSPSLR